MVMRSPQIDVLDVSIVADIGRCTFSQELAVVEAGNLVDQRQHEVHVVRDQRDGDLGGRQTGSSRSRSRRPPASTVVISSWRCPPYDSSLTSQAAPDDGSQAGKQAGDLEGAADPEARPVMALDGAARDGDCGLWQQRKGCQAVPNAAAAMGVCTCSANDLAALPSS